MRCSFHCRAAFSMPSATLRRLIPQHLALHSADCLCKGVNSNSLRSWSTIGSPNTRSFTVTLNVATGLGILASNLRLCEGVRSRTALRWSIDSGAALDSCGEACAGTGHSIAATDRPRVICRSTVVTSRLDGPDSTLALMRVSGPQSVRRVTRVGFRQRPAESDHSREQTFGSMMRAFGVGFRKARPSREEAIRASIFGSPRNTVMPHTIVGASRNGDVTVGGSRGCAPYRKTPAYGSFPGARMLADVCGAGERTWAAA